MTRVRGGLRARLTTVKASRPRATRMPSLSAEGRNDMFGRILVAVDGTPTSNRGLAVAARLAREQGARLYVIHVIDELVIAPTLNGTAAGATEYIEAMLDNLRTRGRKIVASAEAAASKSVSDVNADMVASVGRSVATVILQYARRVRADLIVLGTHGRRGLTRLVMGSDAENVLREATVPVLLVRAPNGAQRPGRSKPVRRSPAQRRVSRSEAA